MQRSKPIHILRYGTVADKSHLEKAINAYDFLSINGNTAAYVSNAIATFVVHKFFDKPDKGFFIDPITYAFQKEIHLLKSRSKTGEISIKKSVKKLIEYYGDPISKVNSDREVTIQDFNDPEGSREFCERVLRFQFSIVSDHIKANDLSKYLVYAANLKNENEINQLKPKFLIAPYFYLDCADPSFKEWLDINIAFAEMSIKMSKQFFSGIPVFAQITVSNRVLLDIDAIQLIADKYTHCNCDGITIWVDELDEHEATKDSLLGFTRLLTKLRNKTILNMYGGYFSILLTNKSINLLKGVSHGLEYGESRKVYPVGGGIPTSKYYYYPLHQRMDFTKSFYLLEYDQILDTSLANWGDCKPYYQKICKCGQCRSIMQNSMINFIKFESDQFYEIKQKNHTLRRKKASPETKTNCLYHYLLCKKMEFSQVKKQSIDFLLNELRETKEKYSGSETLINSDFGYIDCWIETILECCVGEKDEV